MSIIKKGIKAVKKITKKITNFIKKNWVIIAIAALSVFTMGLATVGFAGFSGAMAAAGGGFGGFMSAVGSTMWAGVTALGGSLGIGSGAQGSAAIYGNVEGVGLFGGHAAAALGSESAKAGIAAQQAGMVEGTAGFIGPSSSLAGSAPTATPTLTPGASEATRQAAAKSVSQNALKGAAKSGMGDLTKAALVTTGGNMIAGWAQGKMMGDPKMKGFWGLDMSKKGRRQIQKDAEAGLISAPTAPQAWGGFAQVAPPQAPAPLTDVASPVAAPVAPGLMNMNPEEEDPWQKQGVYA